MNPKEKDELRELRENLLFAINASRYPYPLSKSQIEVVLEAFEHPQPLDAGEWLRKRQIKDSRLWQVYSEKNDPGYSGGEILLSQVLSDFAQASITAKQKEIKKVVEKMERVYIESETHEILDNKISKLIIKLNNILTNE